MFAEPLLQGVHGPAGKLDHLLNHAGSREDALCYRGGDGGSERESRVAGHTTDVDCAGPSISVSHSGEENTHILKEDYFVPGREGQAERPQLGAVLGNPPLTPVPVPSGWESECQFDPGGLSRSPCLAPSCLQHDGLGRPLLSRGCPGTVVRTAVPRVWSAL